MKVKFISWEAACNPIQQMYGEKYRHYGLLLDVTDDVCIVLYFTHEKQMMLTSISKKETGFVELAEVELPYGIHDSAMKYLDAEKTLQEFSNTFLAWVREYRGIIEKVDDALLQTGNIDSSSGNELFDRLSSSMISQPFPRGLGD